MMILAMYLFYKTIKYYFKEKKHLIYISVGLVIFPANLMWYILWPNHFTRISVGLVIFIGIYYFSSGFMKLIREIYISESSGNKSLKISLTFIVEVVAIVLTVYQFILLFN